MKWYFWVGVIIIIVLIGLGGYYFGYVKADFDGDGLSNDAEWSYGTDINNPDTDNDGLKDGEEVDLGTSPVDFDTDRDGLRDGDEVKIYKSDPKDIDTDDDGLTDGYEVQSSHTSPTKADTDGDGLNDKEELERYYTDPLKADTDGDGLNDYDEIIVYITDPNDYDSDDDGLNDYNEVTIGTNPKDPDTDDDGYIDGEDLWPLENKLIVIHVIYYKVEDADWWWWDHSDPRLIVYVDGMRRETRFYKDELEKRDPWYLLIDTPDNKKYFNIKIYMVDEDDYWNPDDPDDTFDIYGGSVRQYWIEVVYEIGSKPILIHEDGSKDGARELDGEIELEIYTTTLKEVPSSKA